MHRLIMAQPQPAYPLLKKVDNLGRTIYIDWNGVERTIYVYYGDTSKMKLKYRLFHKETSLDAYDTSGKSILSYDAGKFEINVPGVWISKDGEVNFRVDKIKLKEWKRISKPKKKLWSSKGNLTGLDPFYYEV